MLMPVSYNYLIEYKCEIQLTLHLMIKKNLIENLNSSLRVRFMHGGEMRG